MRSARHQWQDSGEDGGALLRGLPLAEAEKWHEERGEDLAEAERSFVEASLAARQARRAAETERAARERALEQRGRRMKNLLLGGAVVAAVVGFVLAGAAFAARRESEASALTSQKLALMAKSQELLAKGQGDLALALGLEAVADGVASPAMELALSEAAYAPGTRHVIPVNSAVLQVAIHPSGRWALSSDRNNLRLWDLETGAELRRFEDGHSEDIQGVAFSPDGTLAVSASYDAVGKTPDRSVIVWDVATGRRVQMFRGSSTWVSAAAISPDNRWVLSAAPDGTRLWDIASGQLLHEYPYGSYVRTVAFLPDGRQAISQSGESELVQWDLETGSELRRLSIDPFGGVVAPTLGDLATDPSGTRLAAIFSAEGSIIQLWDLQTGAPLRQLSPAAGNSGPVWSIAFTGDGRQLVMGGPRNDVSAWDVETGADLHHYSDHAGSILDVAVSADGLTALSASGDDASLRVWNLESSAQQWVAPAAGDGGLSVALSPDGSQAAYSGYDGSVWLLDAASGRAIRRLDYHGDGLFTMAFSPDGKRLAGGGASAGVGVWSVDSGGTDWWRHQGQVVRTVAFGASGDSLLASSGDGTVRLWAADSGEEITRLPAPTLIETLRTTVRVWSLSGKPRNSPVAAFGRDPDTVIWGRYAADDKDPEMWDMAMSSVSTGQVLRTFRGHTAWVQAIVAPPDGHTVISGGEDRTVRWWSLTTAKELDHVEFNAGVNALSMSADGRQLSISTGLGDVFLWQVRASAITRRYVGHRDDAWASAISADGRRIVSTGPDGTVRAWPVHASLADLVAWIPTRRHVPALTCEERRRYATLRQCGAGGTLPVGIVQGTAAPAGATRAVSDTLPITAAHPEPMPTLPPLATPLPVIRPAPASGTETAQLLRLEVPFPVDYYFKAPISAMAVSPDGSQALFGMNETVRAFDLETGAEQWQTTSNTVAPALAFTRDGEDSLAGEFETNELLHWDGKGNIRSRVPVGGPVLSLATHPDRRRVAFGTTTALGLWTIGQAEAPDRTAEGYTGITALALSRDGGQLLSGSGDGHVRLWAVGTDGPPRLVRVLGSGDPAHSNLVRTVAFHPDGAIAVSGDAGAVVWWDTATGHEVHRSAEHPGPFSVSFSPDGRYVLTSTEDAVIRILDSASREIVRELKGHTGVRILAAFTEGACKVVSGGDDGLLFVWHTGLCGTDRR
jgi:WD40 repeat protein